MCAVHLRLIGKFLVNFLLVVTELFSLSATTEALRANIDGKWPFLKEGWISLVQNYSRRGHSAPTILLVGKLG